MTKKQLKNLCKRAASVIYRYFVFPDPVCNDKNCEWCGMIRALRKAAKEVAR